MIAATWPRDRSLDPRLMVLEKSTIRSTGLSRLGDFLESGDLLVVNDAATLPGSLRVQLPQGGGAELRLISQVTNRSPAGTHWVAAILGAGDWRDKTENRPEVQQLKEGDRLDLGCGLWAEITHVRGSRWIEICFDLGGDELWSKIYQLGRPIQYSYIRGELPLWSVQTAYAGRPWAAEMPSAGHALKWELMLGLRKRGVGIASLTHAAGISSSGDAEMDRRLPLAERYDIPLETVHAIAHAHRVIAVGTSVTRALEGCRLRNGRLVAGEGVTSLRIGRSFRSRIVAGILSGMHEVGESHFRLLESFASRTQLRKAQQQAESEGYGSHEFGDSCLILRRDRVEV